MRTDTYFERVWRNTGTYSCTYERCIADMWYELVVVTDFVEFCGYPLFLAVLADKMKEGKLIHD